MSVLVEHQHEISRLDGTGAVLFGTETTGYLTLTRPLVIAGDTRTGDRDRAAEDGRAFGRDFRGGKSYSFEIGVLTDAMSVGATNPHAANLDYLNDLEATWNDPWWREHPTRFAMLRSCEAGRTVRCYGRPRRYEEAVGDFTDQGYTPVMAVFDLIDDKWYSDVANVLDIVVGEASEGSLVAPLVAPLTTLGTAVVSAPINVTGSVSTWPVVEIHGPVSRPLVTIGGLEIGLNTVIAEGDHVTFDPRPWVRSVVHSDGHSLAGLVDARTPKMRDCGLARGPHDVTYEGTDYTGTSWARIWWRDARTRP